MTVSASGADVGQDYKWYDGVGTLLQTGGATYTSTVSANTTFCAAIYDTTTLCGTGLTAVTATVNPIPGAPLISGSTSVCTNGHLTLDASGGYDAYQWYLGGIAIAGAMRATYDVASPTTADAGDYTVTSPGRSPGVRPRRRLRR